MPITRSKKIQNPELEQEILKINVKSKAIAKKKVQPKPKNGKVVNTNGSKDK